MTWTFEYFVGIACTTAIANVIPYVPGCLSELEITNLWVWFVKAVEEEYSVRVLEYKIFRSWAFKSDLCYK